MVNLVKPKLDEKYQEYQEYRGQKMPSVNHSFVQTRIAGLLLNDERFTPFVELSLDASQIDLSQFGLKTKEELIPDVCLYEGIHRFNPSNDILKRTDMPLLAVEILSPRQGIDDILAKFKAYFALSIKSCWLIIPSNESITVYSTPEQFKTFGTNDTEINDEKLDICLSIPKLFGK